MKRPKNIASLFRFLQRHAHINRAIQIGFISESMSPATVRDRAFLLCHHVLNTQSQPKLDKMSDFFKSAHGADAFRSYKAFCTFLNLDAHKSLRVALAAQPGWGNKTSALLIRNLALIEQTPKLRSRFWKDVSVIKEDHVALPVDSVITFIFDALQPAMFDEVGDDYRRINTYLRTELEFTSAEMVIWDDLWFWGFITQRIKSSDKTRQHCFWNEAKYWAIPHAPRDDQSIQTIRRLAKSFVAIIDPSCRA